MKNKIMALAINIAKDQRFLANSPAEKDKGGKVFLCAASCIAKAAIEINEGKTASSTFHKEVLNKTKEEYVPYIFEKYDLNKSFANMVMLENDQIDVSNRLNWFSNLKLI